MNTGFKKVKEVFLAALERAPEQRLAFLDQACANLEMRRQVEALLAAHEQAGSFLGPPVEGPAATVSSRAGQAEDETAGPGARIGPYKLLQPIGEGGMGTVWLAEQTQPVQRKVALKLIKPGMDSAQVIARFEAERQALALMDHPNIARVLDAGTAPDNRPFFVMELVKGVPITRYCDEYHLLPRQRLGLFLDVCAAVQHAHTKGIIHRDIKPSNVLVALYDGRPVPKVIDFGVAKATGPRLTERTLFTEFGAIVGTLEYMSPEQAELNQLDIDTRSDVYSLGVLLYELLTGTTPLERKRLKEKGLLEALRLIREEEPPRPSLRLSTTDELPAIAANRGVEPKRLSGLVRGELDWIVLRALDKERARRYESPSAFAEDLRRYLADEPVLACPPSAGYRLRKFARRNKGALATAALVSVVLLLVLVGAPIATGVVWWKWQGETEQRQRADGNLELALDALEKVRLHPLQSELPRARVLHRDERERLHRLLDFYEKFIETNGDVPRVRRETARACWQVGAILRLLGEHDRDDHAEKAFRRSVELYEQLAGESPDEASHRERQAWVLNMLSELLREKGRTREAEETFGRAVALYEELAADFPDNPEYRLGLARVHTNRASLVQDAGQYAQAETLYRRAVALSEELVRDFPGRADCQEHLAVARNNLATALYALNRHAEAERLWGQAVPLLEKATAQSPEKVEYRWHLARTRKNRGRMLHEAGRLPEAEQDLRRGLELFKVLVRDFQVVAEFREDLGDCAFWLSLLLRQTGRPAEAAALASLTLGLRQELLTALANDPVYQDFQARNRLEMAEGLLHEGRLAEAERTYREARDDFARLAATAPDQARFRLGQAEACLNLGEILRQRGRLAEAEKASRLAVQLLAPLTADSSRGPRCRIQLANAHLVLGRTLEATLRPRQAEKSYQTSLALYRQLTAQHPASATCLDGLSSATAHLAKLLGLAGRADQAEKAYRQAIDLLEKACASADGTRQAPPAHRQLLAGCYGNLAALLAGTGRHAEAEKAVRTSIAHREALVKRFPRLPFHRKELVVTRTSFASLLQSAHRHREAEAELRQALEVAEQLVAEFPHTAEHAHHLGRALGLLGDVRLGLNRRAGAEQALRRAIGPGERAVALAPSVPEYRAALASNHSSLGGLLLVSGRAREADGPFARACRLWQQLADEFPDELSYQIGLATAHERLGLALAHANRPRESLAAYGAGIALRRKLAARPGAQTEHHTWLASDLSQLGDLLTNASRLREAEAAYREARDIYQRLVKEKDNPEDNRERLARSHGKLAAVLGQGGLGRHAAAEKEYRAALRIQRELSSPGLPAAQTQRELANLLRDTGRLVEAGRLYEEALRVFQAAQKDRAPEVQADLGACLLNRGELRVKIGQDRQAEQDFHDAVTLLDAVLVARPDRAHQHLLNLAIAHDNLGHLAHRANRRAEAARAYRRAIACKVRLVDLLPHAVGLQDRLGVSYINLAALQRSEGQLDEAEELYRKARDIFSRLAGKFPEVPTNRDRLALARRGLGELYADTRRVADAGAEYRAALAGWQTLVKEFPRERSYRFNLAGCAERLASLLHRTGQPREAQPLFRQAIDGYTGLLREVPADRASRRGLGRAHSALADLLKQTGRPDDAETSYRQAREVLEKLAEQFPAVPIYRDDLATTCLNLANLLQQLGRPAAAGTLYLRTLTLRNKLAGDFPDNPEFRWKVALVHLNHGALLVGQKRLPEAERSFRAGVQCVEKAPAPPLGRFPDLHNALAGCYNGLGHVLGRTGKAAEAEKALNRCLEIREKLMLAAPGLPLNREGLARALVNRAGLHQSAGRHRQAGDDLRRAVQLVPDWPEPGNALAWFLATCPETQFRDPKQSVTLARRVVDKAPGVAAYWNTLGAALYRAGEWKEAGAALEKAMQLSKGGDAGDWFLLVMVRWQQGDRQQARALFDRAASWTDRHRPSDDELRRFRAEAAALLGVADRPPEKLPRPAQEK